jgi:hypothetical protein
LIVSHVSVNQAGLPFDLEKLPQASIWRRVRDWVRETVIHVLRLG